MLQIPAGLGIIFCVTLECSQIRHGRAGRGALTGGQGRGLIEDRAQSDSCEGRGREGAPVEAVEAKSRTAPGRGPGRGSGQARRGAGRGAGGRWRAGRGQVEDAVEARPGARPDRQSPGGNQARDPPGGNDGTRLRHTESRGICAGRAGRCPEHGIRIRLSMGRGFVRGQGGA